MSEYQYHKFCSMKSPLSSDVRKIMHSLSSRAIVSTHSASYVYNYSDFRYDPKEILLNHFDVYFYIANWGVIQLIFKYQTDEINVDEIKKYCIEGVISCERYGEHILLNIENSNEDGFGWTKGEEILPDLLPLYDEIKEKDYRILTLASAINETFFGEEDALSPFLKKTQLSSAQQAYIDNIGID